MTQRTNALELAVMVGLGIITGSAAHTGIVAVMESRWLSAAGYAVVVACLMLGAACLRIRKRDDRG